MCSSTKRFRANSSSVRGRAAVCVLLRLVFYSSRSVATGAIQETELVDASWSTAVHDATPHRVPAVTGEPHKTVNA